MRESNPRPRSVSPRNGRSLIRKRLSRGCPTKPATAVARPRQMFREPVRELLARHLASCDGQHGAFLLLDIRIDLLPARRRRFPAARTPRSTCFPRSATLVCWKPAGAQEEGLATNDRAWPPEAADAKGPMERETRGQGVQATFPRPDGSPRCKLRLRPSAAPRSCRISVSCFS